MSMLCTLLLLVLFSFNALGQNEFIVETVLQKGHARYVSCLDFSPDGKYVATGSYDHKIILWNAHNGKQIRTFSVHTNPVKTLYFSPDGKKLISTSDDQNVFVLDITTGKVLLELTSAGKTFIQAYFSPDGSKIIGATNRSSVVLWDAVSGNEILSFKKSYSANMHAQWASPDGNRFLTYASPKAMQLVNLTDSLVDVTFSIDQPYTYAISSTDKYVAVSSYKSIAKIFDLKTGQELHTLNPSGDKPCDGCKVLLDFSHSGKYIVTSTKYADIMVWDVKRGEIVSRFKKPDVWLDQVKFSPDGKYVVATGSGQSFLYDIRTGKQVFHLSFKGLDCLPVFAPDSKSLLTLNKHNTAAIWDVAGRKQTRLFKGYQNKERTDGLSFNQADWYHTNIIKYLERKNKAILSPDGKYLAKGSIDSVAVLLNLKTGKTERVFSGHSKSVIACAFSHDGHFLLTASGDKTMKLWELASGKLIRTFKGHHALIFDVRFSSDDQLIVSAGWDDSIRIWETATGKVLKFIRTNNASPYSIGFTPNDLYLVSGDLNRELKLWEADAAKEFRNIVGHTNIVSDVCFSPDGKHMVTASYDGSVKVWDFLSGMLINKLTSHLSDVYSVAYHPQGKYIFSGSNDRTIKIWDALSGKEVHTLIGHSGAVTSLQVSNDGSTLVSCSVDGEIKVWDIQSFKELYTYIQIDRENWLAKNPQGYFDGSPVALKHINYVTGLEVVSVGSLFEKYYLPNLIRHIQDDKPFDTTKTAIHTLIKEVPDVKIRVSRDEASVDQVATDSIIAYNSSVSLTIEAIDERSGIDELRIYNNGKLVEHRKYASNSKRAMKKHQETIRIPVSEGENSISAVAFNKERTESQSSPINIYYDGMETDVDLYILSIGINNYQNPAYQLNYAVDDAKAYSRLIRKNGIGIFKSVEEYFIKDADANKKGIQEAFELIARKAGPEDVFVFYFAGHGAMSTGTADRKPEFHIIPYDITQLYGNDQVLSDKAVSANELLKLSMQVAARKQMFILDACQAGGALTSFNHRGGTREKAVAQLARSTGTFFLLASGAIQYASEANDLKHGIFTYALLEGLEGKADGGMLDKKITANELKGYVEDRVPQLTQEYMLTPQYPTGYSYGQDFPIVIVK